MDCPHEIRHFLNCVCTCPFPALDLCKFGLIYLFAFANIYTLAPDTSAEHRETFNHLIAVLWLAGACVGSLICGISTIAWQVIPTNVSRRSTCVHCGSFPLFATRNV